VAPPAAAPPPAGAFPLPPAEKKAAPAPAPTAKPEPAPTFATPPPAQQDARPKRATEGLFDEKRPTEVHHHQPDDDDDTDHFKIGPVVGAGIPALLSVGGMVKITRFLGGGVNLGLIPKVQLSYYGDATLSYKHLDFYGRIYPFGGGVFLHGGVGYATVDGTLTKSVALKDVAPMFPGVPLSGTVTYDSEGSVKTLMLTALLGYFHTFDIGFSIGIDAGAQIPIAPSEISFKSDVNGDIPQQARDEVRKRYLDPNDQEVKDTLEKIGRTTIPTLNFRIGWIL
jgi:hypothetical protein